jgi:phosphate transport system permease protein
VSRDAYSGVRRGKQTPWRVKYSDALISRLITIGGMGTIAAVMLVVLVLLSSAWPLHRSPSIATWRAHPSMHAVTRHFGLDEYGLIAWSCDASGEIVASAVHSGEQLGRFPGPEAGPERQLTASALSLEGLHLVLGFSDGTFQIATLAFRSTLLERRDLPEDIQFGDGAKLWVHDGALYEHLSGDDVRRVELDVPQWTAPEKLAEGPLLALDFIPPNTSNQFSQQSASLLVAATATELVAADIESRENMLTGEVTQAVTTRRCPLQPRSKRPPLGLMIANRATQIIVAWDIGTLDRFALGDDAPALVESTSGIPRGGKFTCAAPLIGRQTMLLGDSLGNLHGWMIVHAEPAAPPRSATSRATNRGGTAPAAASDNLSSSTDLASNTAASTDLASNTAASTDVSIGDSSIGGEAYRLVPARQVRLGNSPVVSVRSSAANHLAVTTTADNRLGLIMVTTDSLLKKAALPALGAPRGAAISSKNEHLIAVGDQQFAVAGVDVAYPEATLRGLFGYVWYEGHAEPKAIWQSSAGTEQSEPKLSLLPLVFGTLKATLYAMIFSIPLAILAAIYTSEFLTPRVRSRVKPLIEMMASLPSVVLGFIAALVLAPLLQQHLTAVLLSLLTVPLTFVFAAHLWNLLPLDALVRLQAWRLWFLAVCVPIGLALAWASAPPVEVWLFSGNITQWLSGNVGSGVGAWMLLLVPAVTAASVLLIVGPLAERNRRRAIALSPLAFAVRGLVRLVGVIVAVIAVAWALSFVLDSLGLDPRQSLFRGYQERNSLLVGAVLGFCVIPLIYTLADDALQSVPQQLRSASLGCGATPWQTTVRVVVPSAMSGIFSAVMIGLGRAVGETMVVLMAAGNTPIMEWNPFNGFRTLSATLATELPEAAKGSTHYRTLFLAALLLFTLTLLANTLAEFVRIRFRKRASQL